MILAIDPGKIKCGLAVLNESGNVLEKKIIPRLEILSDLPFYLSRFSIATVIVGQGAFGKELGKELEFIIRAITLSSVEHFTTPCQKSTKVQYKTDKK